MRFLIDGYNLLYASDLFGEGELLGTLRGSREALLDFLAARLSPGERKATIIVFDAADAPVGAPAQRVHAGIDVRFARNHADADAMIEALLDGLHRRRGLTVVSADHRVQRAARRSGARVVDSEDWLAELSARAAQSRDEEEAKPIDESGASDDDWVNEFDVFVELDQIEEQAAKDPLPRPRPPSHDEPDPPPPPRPARKRPKRRPPISETRDPKPLEGFGEGVFNPFPPGYGDDGAEPDDGKPTPH